MARHLKRIGLVLLLISTLFFVGQAALRWGADYYLREKAHVPIRIGRLFINPATSRVSLSLAGEKAGQELNLDLGAVRLDWWTVFLKRLRVGHVQIEGLRLDVVQEADGKLMVGGIPLASASAQTPPAAEPASPASTKSTWGVGIGGIDLKNVRLDYRRPDLAMNVVIERFHMEPAESWRAETPTPFEGDVSINGGRVHLSGACRPFRADPTLDTTVQVMALPLAWLGPMLKRPGLGGDVDLTLKVEGLEVHPSSPTPTIRLQGFELSKLRVAVTDRGMRPAFRWKAESINLKLSNVNTADPDSEVPVAFDARIRPYETIALKGQWAPLSRVPQGKLNLKIDGFNLSPFTPFAENAAGYRLASGLLELNTTVEVRQGVLQSGNRFVAHQFHLEKLKADELDASATQIGLPLNLCLALLRDADDNIRLDVPVSGDLRDPKVPVGQLVWQVLGKAMAAALRAAATAFFPSGSHLGFDPILFAPGQSTLSPEGTAYLVQVGEKLSQRPAVGLRISATAVAADWYALRQQKPPEPALALDPAQVTAEDQERLLALAARRMDALRAALVEQSHIDPKRLPGTAPHLDLSPTGQPRAELAL